MASAAFAWLGATTNDQIDRPLTKSAPQLSLGLNWRLDTRLFQAGEARTIDSASQLADPSRFLRARHI